MSRKRLFHISIFALVGVVALGSIAVRSRYLGSHVTRTERAIDWLSSSLELTEV